MLMILPWSGSPAFVSLIGVCVRGDFGIMLKEFSVPFTKQLIFFYLLTTYYIKSGIPSD